MADNVGLESYWEKSEGAGPVIAGILSRLSNALTKHQVLPKTVVVQKPLSLCRLGLLFLRQPVQKQS
jgi:hypothetical protein